MADWTRELIVEAAKKAAANCDGPLSKSDFCQRSGANDYHIYRLFPEGGWTEAWREELGHRLEEIRSGQVVGVPAEDVLGRLRERYP